MGGRTARQLFVVGLALVLWAVVGRAGWLELLACYLTAVLLWDVATAWQWLPDMRPRTLVTLAVLLAAPGLRFGWSTRQQLLEGAGLVGVTERVRDRTRLSHLPAIAPGLLSTAQPQTFFVHAPGASKVSLALADGVEPLAAEQLGSGLFRVDYDPRRDGTPPIDDGELPVSIVADARAYERSVRVVTPLAHPRWFCRSPTGQRAATTSEESDELIVVQGSASRIPVGDGPIACAFVDETTIAISHRHASELRLVDVSVMPATSRVFSLAAPLGRVCFDEARRELLVARQGPRPAVVHVTWPELALKATTPLPAAADWLAMVNDGELVVATRADASLHLLRRQGDRYVHAKQLALGRPAAAMAVDPERGRIFVSVTDYHPESEPQLGNHFVQDQLLVVDSRELEVSQRVLTARRSARQTKPGDVDQGGSPLGLWPLADGRLAVTFAGTDELWRLGLPTADPDILSLRSDAFFAPHGVVELADGTLWLAAPAAGALATIMAGGRLRVVPLAPGDAELMAKRPDALARRLGERTFYESTRSGIACQSCHLHADSDLAAYNLGDHRLVPTLSVRGLLGTAPYLRDGSYPRIGDLDEVAEELYRGYPRAQPGRRYTLQTYVESLPRTRSVVLRDPAAERRGFAVFLRAGCARCHTPPAFTNLGQLPLAALFPRVAATLPTPETLDVPSLLSVAASSPYLHDGRAPTLQAVLNEENPDDLHGKTQTLTAADRADLLRFLASL